MGQIAEPKIEEETIAKTTRDKRSQIRKANAEKAQMKAATAKVGIQQEKGKTHPKISVIQTETMDTEISTGSKEK